MTDPSETLVDLVAESLYRAYGYTVPWLECRSNIRNGYRQSARAALASLREAPAELLWRELPALAAERDRLREAEGQVVQSACDEIRSSDEQVRLACNAFVADLVSDQRVDVTMTCQRPDVLHCIRIERPFRLEVAMRAALEAAREERDAD